MPFILENHQTHTNNNKIAFEQFNPAIAAQQRLIRENAIHCATFHLDVCQSTLNHYQQVKYMRLVVNTLNPLTSIKSTHFRYAQFENRNCVCVCVFRREEKKLYLRPHANNENMVRPSVPILQYTIHVVISSVFVVDFVYLFNGCCAALNNYE